MWPGCKAKFAPTTTVVGTRERELVLGLYVRVLVLILRRLFTLLFIGAKLDGVTKFVVVRVKRQGTKW
jgi:hypothetical protein